MTRFALANNASGDTSDRSHSPTHSDDEANQTLLSLARQLFKQDSGVVDNQLTNQQVKKR
jgi:hypothetical protein